MMDRQQFLLTKLAEEASEVAQIALKTQQFGFDETRPDQPFSNRERIHQELIDLFTIISMLNEETELEFEFDVEDDETCASRVEMKKAKVNKYYEYSRKLGEVE